MTLDERLAPGGDARPGWAAITGFAERAGAPALSAETRRLVAEEGITHRPSGQDEQPWALDPLPVPLAADEWAVLEAGVAQRAHLMELLLADLYGPRLTLRTGLLPVEVVLGHPGFVPGWTHSGAPRQVFLAGFDLARTPDGWHVLADRVQAPSGAGYALAGRRVVARVLAEVRRGSRIRRLGPFFDAVRRGLEELAPDAEHPRVVLLTPGPEGETAYEQALLAARLGFPLAQGSELTVREGRVWRRTLGRLEPVDVILRRVDAAWCDPLDLRQDSQLGVPGLLEVARTGGVAVVNGIGSGVAENPALLPFLPALARALLDEAPVLPGPPTWWCGDPAGLSHVVARMPELLVRPIARGAGRASVDGSTLDAAGRAALADRVRAEPHAWVGQERLVPSTVPLVGAAAEPLVMRTFAVAADGTFRVLAGGLGQAGAPDATVAKDIWVLGPGVVPEPVAPPAVPDVAEVLTPRVASDLFWLGRYAERAEGTARLLRAVADRVADFGTAPEPAGAEAVEVLLAATSAVTATPPGTDLPALVSDRWRPGTLAYAVHRMTRAAQSVRELLSTDTWLVLGRLDSELATLRAAGAGPASREVSRALSRVLEGLLALAGLTAESLVRDAGWHLLDAGRRVERARHLATLLGATMAGPPRPSDALVVESVLIVAESVVTHRRRQRDGADAVLELLVTDRRNPRSLAFQIERLAADLAELPGPDGAAGAALDAIARALDAARADELGRRGRDDGRTDLRRLAAGLERDLDGFADVLEATRFAAVAPPRPLGPIAAMGVAGS